MTEMIERVAAAIWDSHELGDFAAATSIDRGFHINAARAAIEAMQQHTPAMDSAGYDAYPDSTIRTGVDHLDIYRAMIKAALEGPSP